MTSPFCEFVYRNDLKEEVECPECHRAFSGSPERYANRIVCKSKASTMDGPGTDLEAIFAYWAGKFKKTFKTCGGCNELKVSMNLNGKEWVRQNISELTAAIQANARLQNITIPSLFIKRWLRKVSK